MKRLLQNIRSLVVAFYAWIAAIFFGLIILDIVYAKLLRAVPGAAGVTTVSSEVADILLLAGFIMILAAIGAIVFSWTSGTARNLLIASLFVVILEFITPVFLSPFFQILGELNIGFWLRIIPSGLASILALVGLYKFRHSGVYDN